MRLYVGNLPYDVTEDELKAQFETYGSVTSSTIPKDKDTGRSKGFGFVDMPTQAEAEAAIQALNGKPFKDRTLTVSEARPREEGASRPPRGGGSYGGGGGYGGGGRGGGGGGRGGRY
jgi:cold-inducible RNA-binding protein